MNVNAKRKYILTGRRIHNRLGPGETVGETKEKPPDCVWTGVELAGGWDMVPTDPITTALRVSADFTSFPFDLQCRALCASGSCTETTVLA